MEYLVGIALQWLRSLQINMYLREGLVVVLATIAASVALYLAPEFKEVHSVRDFLLALKPFYGQIATGLVTTSITANVLVKAGVNPDHPLIPVTAKE